jgi:hypothetical protein
LEDNEAQVHLLKDLDLEVSLIQGGDEERVKLCNLVMLPTVQHISDSYHIQQKKALDAHRARLEASSLVLKDGLSNIPLASREAPADESEVAATLEEMTDEIDIERKNDLEDNWLKARTDIERKVDFNNSDFSDLLHECRLTGSDSVVKSKPYEKTVELFIIDTRQLLTASLKRTIAETLDFFGKENSIAFVFCQPVQFEFWRATFTEATAKSSKWIWHHTLVLLSKPPKNSARAKLKLVSEFGLVFGRNKELIVNSAEFLSKFGESDFALTDVLSDIKVCIVCDIFVRARFYIVNLCIYIGSCVFLGPSQGQW